MNVRRITLDEAAEGQRLDNFLTTHLKGVPSSRIYRAIRTGEVRVNGKRVLANYRLQKEDEIRIPPLRVAESKAKPKPPPRLLKQLEERMLFETDDLLVINKPAGLPVHGGSGVSWGLIEMLRELRPKARMLELVHRLDRDTSGCLLVAKKRPILIALHALLKNRQVKKQYLALVKGRWKGGVRRVETLLKKNILQSGERMVRVHESGKSAVTRFSPLKIFAEATLVEARPLTGRTHQIRVHAAHIGHPIVGDEKYGDPKFNARMRTLGIKRLFLHSAGIYCHLPENNQMIGICALLDEELKQVLMNPSFVR